MNDKIHVTRKTYNGYGLSSIKKYEYDLFEMVSDLKGLLNEFEQWYIALGRDEKYRTDFKLLNKTLDMGKKLTRITKGKVVIDE